MIIYLSLYFFLSDFLDFNDESDVEGGLLVEGGLVDIDWGILVGDGTEVLVDEVLVSEEVGVFVGEAEGVLIEVVNGVFVRDFNGDLGGKLTGFWLGRPTGF